MAINNPIITDSDWLQAAAVAIQNKDGGGKIEVPDFASRIEAIPTGSDFDMTVTDNQVKMVIEVDDFDLSLWTRFGISGGGTVTVDWGDGTVNEYTGNVVLEYAPQRKHNYQKAGRYLITETVVNGKIIIGSINDYATLSEGPLQGDINSFDFLRRTYNYKIKEVSFGFQVRFWGGLRNIPYVKIHTPVYYWLYMSSVPFINIYKNSTFAVFDEYSFCNVTAFSIKIPSTITKFANNSFDNSKIRLFDFTDIRLNDDGELPITFASTNVFQGISNNTIFLFATQEISEVAKTTTNLSQLASQIKYVGEV